MDNGSENTFSLRDFYYILFKHKKTIIILFFSTVLTAIIGVYLWPETYEAKSKILVKVGRENISLPVVTPTASQQLIASLGVRREDINSEIEILQNRFIIEKLVKKLGTDFFFPKATKPETIFKKIKYEFKLVFKRIRDFLDEILYRLDLQKRLSSFEKAVMVIQKGLSAKQISNSDVIEVQLKWFSPDIAKVVVEALTDFYLEHHLETHKTSGAYEFLRQQVEIIEKKLKDSEYTLQLLKEKQEITSYETQRKLLLENITNLQSLLKNTQTELTETVTKINKLKEQLSLLPKTIQLTKELNRNPAIDSLKAKLLELELEKNKLEKKYMENSRPVVSISEEIEKVKRQLDEEVTNVVRAITTGINTTYKDTEKELLLQEVNLGALNAKNKMLEQHIRSYTKDLERLNQYDVDLKRLNRQIQIDEENYQIYRKKLEEARISDVLDKERIVNVKVIEPATASFTPVKPKKLLTIAISFPLSLIVGIGLAFVLEYLDHSIKTPEDVKKYLNLPLLGSIKEMKN